MNPKWISNGLLNTALQLRFYHLELTFERWALSGSIGQLAQKPVHDVLQSPTGVVDLSEIIVPRAVQCQPTVT